MSEQPDSSLPDAGATLGVSDSDRTRSMDAAIARAAGPEAGDVAAAAGREFGTVRIRREIGRGAMGVVYLGHDRVLERDVALKALVNIGSGGGEDISSAFLREARAAATVKHSNLTQIHHADVAADGTPFLVMEHVDGPSLAQLLKSCGPMKPAVVVSILGDICAAVEALHEREVVHRDLKPSNVLIDAEGQVYVTDFGLAVKRSGPSSAPAGAAVAGTPLYMAPEMFEGQISPRSDIYAIGVMGFEMLCGHVPFSGSLEEVRRRHAEEDLPVAGLRERGVPEELIDLLERATHKKAMFRHKTARELARAVQQVSRSIPGTAAARIDLRRMLLGHGEPGPNEAPLSVVTAAPAGAAAASSTSYMDTLAQIAAVKRERRMRLLEPDLAAARPADAPSGAPVPQVDLPCAGCGYNVRGLPGDGQCPECGAPIAESLAPDRLLFADEQWLRVVSAGVTMIVCAAAGAALLYAVFQPLIFMALSMMHRAGNAPPAAWLAIVTRVAAPLLSTAFMAGVIAATLREPLAPARAQPWFLRRSVRGAAVIGCLLVALAALMEAGESAKFVSRFRILLGLTTFMSMGGAVLYFAWLSRRAGDATLERHLRRSGWLMIGTGVVLVVVELIALGAADPLSRVAGILMPIFLAELTVMGAVMLWMMLRIRRMIGATLARRPPAAAIAALRAAW